MEALKFNNKLYFVRRFVTFLSRYELFDVPFSISYEHLIPISVDKNGNPEPYDNQCNEFCHWCKDYIF